MDKLIICSTNYQIFNAVTLALSNKNKKFFLFLLDYNETVINKFYVLKLSEIFEFVYIFQFKKFFKTKKKSIFSISSYIKIFYNTLVFLNKNNLPKLNLDEVIICGPDIPNYLIYSFYKNSSSNNVKISLLEEGIYTYYFNPLNINIFKKIVYKFIFNINSKKDFLKVYLYKPNLKKQITNVKFEKLNSEIISKYKGFYRLIFGDDISSIFNFKYILLDSAFQKNKNNVKQIYIFKLISKIIDTNTTVLKLHPRSNKDKYLLPIKLDFNETLFEWSLNNVITNDKVFFSIFSSSLFTPFLIFNQTPFLVLLDKLLNIKPPLGSIDFFIKSLSLIYGKIFIPKNESELIDFLNKLRS